LREGADPVLNRLSVEALRWPHLRVGAFRFDRNEGTQLGVDAVGFRLPFALSGTTASQSFTILQVGGDLGYRWQSRELGALLPAATPDAHAASVELTCRVDQLTALTDRLGLRSFEEITGLLLLCHNVCRPWLDVVGGGKRFHCHMHMFSSYCRTLRTRRRMEVSIEDFASCRRISYIGIRLCHGH
jgi:hypothetical protein